MINKIIVLNSISNIKIYDGNNIVCDRICNGYILFKGKINKIYKIVITSKYGCIISSFIVNKNLNTIIYSFNQNSHKIVTFKLYDSNYENLPIEKGVIKLWQNHT